MEPFSPESSCLHSRLVCPQQLQSKDRMGVEDGTAVMGGQKRERDLQADEESRLSFPESQEGLKRRCLEPVGDENINPLHHRVGSPSRPRIRQLEREVKPDTPVVSSIRSRMQWLAQRQGGTAEFRSRVERFQLAQPPSSPVLTTPRSRVLSSLTRSVQQKLQSADTPSASRASRIRQEREEELRLLRSQPISDNAWMRRSLSDSSMAEVEASGKSESSDEPPGPTDGCEPACLLNFNEEPYSNTGKQKEEKGPSSENEQNFAVGMLEVSACSFEKGELDLLPSDVVEFAEGQQQEGLGSSRSEEEEEQLPPVVEEQGEEEEEPPPVVEEHSEEKQMPPGEEAQSEEEGGQQLLRAEEQGRAKKVLNVKVQGPVEEAPSVKEQNSLQTALWGQTKVESVVESKLIWCDTSEVEERTSAGTDQSQDEMSSSAMIDQLFAGVLDTEEEDKEDKNWKGHGAEGVGEEMGHVAEGVAAEGSSLDSSADELLTIPPSCILSPLSKSVEAAVTPLRLASSCLPDITSAGCAPEQPSSPPASSGPLYSIDAYRLQWQNSQPTMQNVNPTVIRREPQASVTQPLINTKNRIKALSEEAVKLQGIITQTLQALSCCTDEEHGKGSLEEVEAEKLLLVSCEKRTALLAEVARLRAGGDVDSESAVTGGPSQEPCRGTVTITHIQLPLKVDFVCSSLTRAGRPTHYFFVLIRYGPCNIVATPLATAADAQTGDTISFSTSVTLQEIRSNFEIDVEVYSLSQTPGNNVNTERFSTKSKVTPKKFLSSIKRPNHSAALATLTSVGHQRSSNFSLVGSHKITIASLGQTKFPLDKMKFDGKVRKLLGDEFQEKVPFLSPLVGNIYLRLDCESHSNVQHKGFLTMFEDVCGFAAWQRRWFTLEQSLLSYWNYPSDERSKPPEGSISLARCTDQCVRLVKRDSCARPHTFELVSSKVLQENDGHPHDKCWFSADTHEERAEWMEKLNQAILDLRTWMTTVPEASRPCRESIL